MQWSVVVTSFSFCHGTVLLPARLGKATGGKSMTWKRESDVKKTNSSVNNNNAPEHAGSSPSHVMPCKTLCFLHAPLGPEPQQV